MLSWLAEKMIARNMRSIRAGDPGPTLAMDADDVKFTFPATARSRRGQAISASWSNGLTASSGSGCRSTPMRCSSRGSPGARRSASAAHIHLDDPDDGRVYDNRYVIWGRIAWGKLREYEVYEDTEQSRKLDEYLARDRPEEPSGARVSKRGQGEGTAVRALVRGTVQGVGFPRGDAAAGRTRSG